MSKYKYDYMHMHDLSKYKFTNFKKYSFLSATFKFAQFWTNFGFLLIT